LGRGAGLSRRNSIYPKVREQSNSFRLLLTCPAPDWSEGDPANIFYLPGFADPQLKNMIIIMHLFYLVSILWIRHGIIPYDNDPWNLPIRIIQITSNTYGKTNLYSN
jgi:hypothetical protein